MECNFDLVTKQQGIFFTLKENILVQSVLINSLLTRYNCSIDDLALILSIDAEILGKAWKEERTLSENDSKNLVSLFYILNYGN